MTAKKRSLRGLSPALLPPYMQARELAAWTLDQVHAHQKRFEVHGRGWCSYCILGHFLGHSPVGVSIIESQFLMVRGSQQELATIFALPIASTNKGQVAVCAFQLGENST